MPTNFVLRIIIISPTGAKATGIAAWLNANIGANTVPANLGPGLSASGNSPVTHRWCNNAYSDTEAKAILSELCDRAAIAKPTNNQWNGWTKQQKVQWLKTVQAAIRTNYDVWITLAGNENTWDEPDEQLAALGLKVIG